MPGARVEAAATAFSPWAAVLPPAVPSATRAWGMAATVALPYSLTFS